MFKKDGKLYLLLTDIGYEHMSNVVWERLDHIDGNTILCNSAFQDAPAAPSTAAVVEAAETFAGNFSIGVAPAPGSQGEVIQAQIVENPAAHNTVADSDFMLAVQLQEEEEARARALGAEESQRPVQQTSRRRERRRSRGSNCAIS